MPCVATGFWMVVWNMPQPNSSTSSANRWIASPFFSVTYEEHFLCRGIWCVFHATLRPVPVVSSPTHPRDHRLPATARKLLSPLVQLFLSANTSKCYAYGL